MMGEGGLNGKSSDTAAVHESEQQSSPSWFPLLLGIQSKETLDVECCTRCLTSSIKNCGNQDSGYRLYHDAPKRGVVLGALLSCLANQIRTWRREKPSVWNSVARLGSMKPVDQIKTLLFYTMKAASEEPPRFGKSQPQILTVEEEV